VGAEQPQGAARKGKVQLIDGSQHFAKMRKSLGSKRQYLTDEHIDELVRLYGRFEQTRRARSSPSKPSATGASPSSARCA
jgi:type I restriction enzyme M protein